MSDDVGSKPNRPETWDACWKRDESGVMEDLTVSRLMDDVKFGYLDPMLPRSGTIVEFGCGSARLLRFAMARGMTAIGADFSDRALALARSAAASPVYANRLHLVRTDVHRMPLPDDSVDVVGSTGLLEHFERPEAVIAEMTRVLRPGGLFYSDIVPKKFSLYRALDGLRRNELKVFERPMTRDQIEGMMRDTGLVDIRVFGAGVFPPSIPVIERSRSVRKAIARVVRGTLPLWQSLDATPIADLLGFYFFATGRKPA